MTLQEMIDRQAPAGTLVLHPANQEFNGPIVLRQPLTLQGRGATIRAAKGPLVILESSGVTLQDLNLEITSDQRLKDEEALALLVEPGIVIATGNISLRGNVFGIAGEEGRWHYPNSIRLGKLEPDREHAFQLRLGLPVACKMVCDIDGLRVEPDVYSGSATTDVVLRVDALAPGTHIRGKLFIHTRSFTRHILIAGNAARTGSGSNVQGNGQPVYDCLDPHAKLACSAASTVSVTPVVPPSVAASGCEAAAPVTRITNSIGLKLVRIPAGEFLMGLPDSDAACDSYERPQHRVRITKPFFLGTCPVTQKQYQRVVGTNPSCFQGPNRPVETVSWEDAIEFCRLLTERERKSGVLPAGAEYRLPTDAEWEYACRAGSTSRYCFGDDESQLEDYAWYAANSGAETHPVGQKKPNAWGLYDMHGNVWEWCQDWFGDYPSGVATDPQGPSSGSYRVLRGGNWLCGAGVCQAAIRARVEPSYRDDYLGFRLARSVP